MGPDAGAMTARTFLRHAGGTRGSGFRVPASRKGEQRFIGPRDKKDPAPPAREEYPGPQTSSNGEHIEPGETRPTRRGR